MFCVALARIFFGQGVIRIPEHPDSGFSAHLVNTGDCRGSHPPNRLRVLREWFWSRAAGGLVFIAQHNFFDFNVEPVLRDAGWVKTNVLGGERRTNLARPGSRFTTRPAKKAGRTKACTGVVADPAGIKWKRTGSIVKS